MFEEMHQVSHKAHETESHTMLFQQLTFISNDLLNHSELRIFIFTIKSSISSSLRSFLTPAIWGDFVCYNFTLD